MRTSQVDQENYSLYVLALHYALTACLWEFLTINQNIKSFSHSRALQQHDKDTDNYLLVSYPLISRAGQSPCLLSSRHYTALGKYKQTLQPGV